MNQKQLTRFLQLFVLPALLAFNIGCDSDSVTSGVQDENGNDAKPMDPFDFEDQLAVHYINLDLDDSDFDEGETRGKEGDAIVIQTPNDLTIMIDAGRTQAGYQTDAYLDILGIDTIDVAFTTHPHIDHIGGFLTLIETKEIKKFYKPHVNHIASYYNEFIDMIDEYDIEYEYLESGDILSFNEGLEEEIQIDVFSPPEGTEPPNDTDIHTINDLSLVIKLTYGNTSYLFTGDIGQNRERTIIQNHGEESLKANFLHAGHHGSNTSSSLVFIQAVDPEYAVISHDVIDEYVYNRYQNHGTEVYVTGRDGHIILLSDGEQISVETRKFDL